MVARARLSSFIVVLVILFGAVASPGLTAAGAPSQAPIASGAPSPVASPDATATDGSAGEAGADQGQPAGDAAISLQQGRPAGVMGGTVAFGAAASGAGQPVVASEVRSALQGASEVAVIVRLRQQVEIGQLAADARAVGRENGRAARVRAVVTALRDIADATQGPVRGLLQAEERAGRASNVRSFWVFNGFAATVSAAALDRLANHTDVASITLDEEIVLPEPSSGPRLPTWGLEKVNAPTAWGEYGVTGEGVVVGTMDSGVDGGHPALAGRYRGRNGDDLHSWYAATGENYAAPGDGHGHGTHVMGTILGGAPGETVGVAPGADWIAVKIFRDSGSTSSSIIHDGFQWMLAPGGDPAMAPDVVNNSWGSDATYSTEFWDDVNAWVAAGIFPAFANGNNGPGAGSVGSPGSFPQAFGVGATDINDLIASFSSRGPAIWDGVEYTKPQVSAPGVDIFSAWPRQLDPDGYNTISGTSMATPHLTGVVALLLSAAPELTVDDLRELLTSTVQAAPHMGHLPNDDYGAGIVDAAAAIVAAKFSGTLSGVVSGPAGPLADVEVAIPALGIATTSDASGYYELRVEQGSWSVEATAYGYVGDGADVTIAAGDELTQDFTLAAAPVHAVSGTVVAGGSPLPGAVVRVLGTPIAPAYTAADGSYQLDVAAGSYTIAADATGYRRTTQTLTVDSDKVVDFILQPLGGSIEPGWNEYQNNAARTGLSPEQLAAGALTEEWSVDLPGQVLFASPVIADGRAYIAFDGGQLVALDLDTGERAWAFSGGTAMRGTPAVSDGRLFIGGGDSGTMHALDATTGAALWSFDTGDRLTYAAPTVVEGTLYFGTGWGEGNGGWLYALDAATGGLRWKYFVGPEIYFAPAVGGSSVFAGSYGAQRLVALDAETGALRWELSRAAAGDSFAAMPSYAGGVVYAATNNFDTGAGSLLAIEAASGDLLWEATGHGDAAGNTPVVFGDLVIAGSSLNNWVAAYDRATGERAWVYSAGAAVSNSQLVADGVLVGGSQQDHRAWALDAYTGELLWEAAMSDNILSAPAMADGRLVVADRSGVIKAFQAPGTLTGTVSGPSGPIAASVSVIDGDATVDTDPATGTYELAIAPGEVSVEARAYGYLAEERDLVMRSGQETTADFVLEIAPDGSLSGTVSTEAGSPLEGVSVTLEGTPLDPAITAADGSFSFPVVAEGRYDLAASLPGYASLVEEVSVVGGEETPVALTLLRYEIAVTGDYGNAISSLLTGQGYRVESTTAAAIADRPGDYQLIVANGAQDDPGAGAFTQLVANAEAAGTSIVFLDTWGISYGALRHLSVYTGDPATTGSDYGDGVISLVASADHPLTAGLAPGVRVPILASDREYAWFGGYSGRTLAEVHAGEVGSVGAGIGFEPRSFGSVHVLLSLHAASPWVGPTDGWTPAAHQVFDNAVTYALDASFGEVAGTVTAAADGAGLPARVTALETGDSTVAAADGSYSLLLPAGSYTLRFERVGYAPIELTADVTDGTTTTVDAQLASSGLGSVTGTVTDLATGDPLAGATVNVVGSGAPAALTGADGSYVVDGVPGGAYSVEVSADGYVTETVADVAIVDGEVMTLDVALARQIRVAVIGDADDVVDDEISTLLNANQVTATPTGWEAVDQLDLYDLVIVHDPTDPGEEAFLAALDKLDVAGVSAIFVEGAFTSDGGVRLLREYLGSPTGRDFVSSDGRPLFTAVDVGHPLFDGLVSPVQVLVDDEWGGFFTGYDGMPIAEFGTDELGTLGIGAAFEPRTPESVRLLLSGLSASFIASPSEGWTDDGVTLFLNAIRWAADPQLGSVTGRITDAGGDPVAAHLEIMESGIARDAASDGTYTLPHVAGSYTLRVSAFGYVTQELPVSIAAGDSTELNVTMALGDVGSIAGIVTSRPDLSPTAGEGEPLAGATVRLVGQSRSTTTDESGAYALPNVEPGSYQVEFLADGHVRQVVPDVIVAGGEQTTLDLALRPSPRVGVIDDCQQRTDCRDKMQAYLAEWGYLPEEIGWEDLDVIAELDLVVANLGDFPRSDPGAGGLAAFRDAADRAHVPVVWLEQYQRGSIRWLSEYEGDPADVGEARSRGTVQAQVLVDHPLVAGFDIGELVPMIESGGEHTWFNGYGGTTVANLVTGSGGEVGSAIAFRGRTASTADVLLSSFAVTYYTWPPVGNEPAQLITPQAELLFHNALNWALDAPPLAAEVRGNLGSSAGGPLTGTVTVLESGEVYPARAGDGTYLVPLQPGTWTLRYEAFGHDPQDHAVTVAAGAALTLNVVLDRQASGSLAGTVRNEAGTPIGGASVAVLGTPLSATTGADGTYAIGGIPTGEHTVRVTADGYAVAQEAVTIAAGATTTLDVALPVSQVVAVAGDYQGRLTTFLEANGYEVRAWSWADVQNHVPELGEVGLVILNGSGSAPTSSEFTAFMTAADVAGVSVILAGQYGNGSIRRASDYLGDPEDWTQGFAAGGIYYRPASDHPIFAGFPTGDPIEILRDPAGGNQQYEFFTGYSGTTVAALGSEAAGDLGGGVGVKFSSPTSVHVLLDGLAASSYASPPDGWSAAAGEIYLNAVAFALDAAQGQITGTVTDAASGEPLTNVLVTALEAGASTRTGPDGTYRLGVADGTYTVRFELIGYESLEESVAVADEATVTLDMALTAIPRGALEVTVVDPEGAPIAGATVTLSGPSSGELVTGSDGIATFGDLLPGEYAVDVMADGFQPASAGATVQAGATASLELSLVANDTAVLGDVDGVLIDFLRANDVAAEEIGWETAADEVTRFEVVIVNGGDPTEEQFDALLEAADASHTSVVFTGTWGVAEGGIRLLEAFEPETVSVGAQGYGDGAVSITGFEPTHPLFDGLADPAQLLDDDGYWAAIDSYVGPYLAELTVEEAGDGANEGVAVAADWRTADSMHLLLGISAVSGLIGPGYGWTDDGAQLLLNGIAWARDGVQPPPAAPTLVADEPLLTTDATLSLHGTAEFRSTVSVLRDGVVIATAEPARDGSFAVEVVLVEGVNALTAVAANHAGDSPPSVPVQAVLDTTGPDLAWTPDDGDGVFGPVATVTGVVTDPYAGVVVLTVNGDAVAWDGDGAFGVDVPVATGENVITVVAHDTLGNETSQTHTVYSFPYSATWQVAGERGHGALIAFLQVLDAEGTPLVVDSAVAELRTLDGELVASDVMGWDDAEDRYIGNLGHPARGRYRLWAELVVDGWNVTLEGPEVRRR